MSANDIVTVIVGHRLGRVEAARRIKDALAQAHGRLGAMIAIDQETWQDDTLHFRMRVLGQAAAARIEVMEEAMRIDVSLPWLLGKLANRLLPIVREEAALLLEKTTS